MKPYLLVTTALLGLGGTASPALGQIDVSLGGEIQFMLGLYDEDERGTNDRETHHRFGTDAQFQVDVRGVSDSGIVYGGRIDIEDDGNAGLYVDEAYIFVSGGFGTVIFGNDDGANDIARNVPGTGVGIVDGDYRDYLRRGPVVFYDTRDSSDAAKIYYRTSGAAGAPGIAVLSDHNVTLGFSYAPDTDQALDPGNVSRPGNEGEEPSYAHMFEIGAAWSPRFGPVTVTPSAAVTYAVAGLNGNRDDFFGAQGNLNLSLGGFRAGVGFAYIGEGMPGDNDNWGVNAGATYTTGPWTLGTRYSYGVNDLHYSASLESHSFGMGLEYRWLPGLDIEADLVGFATDAAIENSGVVGLARVNLSF